MHSSRHLNRPRQTLAPRWVWCWKSLRKSKSKLEKHTEPKKSISGLSVKKRGTCFGNCMVSGTAAVWAAKLVSAWLVYGRTWMSWDMSTAITAKSFGCYCWIAKTLHLKPMQICKTQSRSWNVTGGQA